MVRVEHQHGGERKGSGQAHRDPPLGGGDQQVPVGLDLLEQVDACGEGADHHRPQQPQVGREGGADHVQHVPGTDLEALEVGGGARLGVAVHAPQADGAVGPAPEGQQGRGEDRGDRQQPPLAHGHQQRAQHADDRVGGQDVAAEQQDPVGEAQQQERQVAPCGARQEGAGALPAGLGAAVQDPDAVAEQHREQGEAAVVDGERGDHVHDAVGDGGVGLLEQHRPLGAVEPADGVGHGDAQQGKAPGQVRPAGALGQGDGGGG